MQKLGDIKRDYHEKVDQANDEICTLYSLGKDKFQKIVSPKLQIV